MFQKGAWPFLLQNNKTKITFKLTFDHFVYKYSHCANYNFNKEGLEEFTRTITRHNKKKGLN